MKKGDLMKKYIVVFLCVALLVFAGCNKTKNIDASAECTPTAGLSEETESTNINDENKNNSTDVKLNSETLVESTAAILMKTYNTDKHWCDCLTKKTVVLVSSKEIVVSSVLPEIVTNTIIPFTSVSEIKQNTVQDMTFISIIENSGNETQVNLYNSDAESFISTYNNAK